MRSSNSTGFWPSTLVSVDATERALLDAILAAPDDDAPRVVYADWLQQRGDPRGELIAVGLELARMAPGDPRRRELAERHEVLERAHRIVVDGKPVVGMYERGFPTDIGLWGDELDRLAKVVPLAPLVSLGISYVDDAQLCRLATMSIGTIRRLYVRAVDRTPRVVLSASLRALAAWSELHKLDRLDLWAKLDRAAFRAILFADGLRLRHLRLGKTSLGSAAVNAIVESPQATTLETLVIEGSRVGSHAGRLVACTGLRELTLATAEITSRDVAALAPLLPQLERFDLGGNLLGDDIGTALVVPGVLRDLSLTSMTDRSLAGIVTAPLAQQLERLSLRLSRFTARGLRVFAAWPGLRTIRALALDHCYVEPAGALALAASPHAGAIEYLDLRYTYVGEEAEAALRERFGTRVQLPLPHDDTP